MIVQGFPPEKLHIASFNTTGTVLKPRHHSAAGVQHMPQGHRRKRWNGLWLSHHRTARQWRAPAVGAELIIFAVGDEAGEAGESFAQNIQNSGYTPRAFAHIVNVARNESRGTTVRRAAEVLRVPYTEVNVEQFTDVYQVQRTLKAVLEAQPYREKGSMIEKIMQTELLLSPY
jgi:hypothetical protein